MQKKQFENEMNKKNIDFYKLNMIFISNIINIIKIIRTIYEYNLS